ncbi:MAG: hypothetical protein ACTSRG_25100 [Candidatus Helarchaeota archaeon]
MRKWHTVAFKVTPRGSHLKWGIRIKAYKNWGKWEIVDPAFRIMASKEFKSWKEAVSEVESGEVEKILNQIFKVTVNHGFQDLKTMKFFSWM